MTCDNQFWLTIQADGNLVLYQANPGGGATALWTTNSVGSFADHVYMQGDGNLTVLNSAGGIVWTSDTAGHDGARLILDAQGHLTVSNGTTPYWGSSFPLSPNSCGSLMPGQGLHTGESLVSCNGRFVLTMQNDGNLVLADNLTGTYPWASGTQGLQVYAGMTSQGLYLNEAGAPTDIWHSNPPSGYGNAYLTLFDSGMLAVFDTAPTGLTVLEFGVNRYDSADPFEAYASDVGSWTAMDYSVQCPTGTVVDGVGCNGQNCSEFNLRCSPMPPSTFVWPGNTATTPWFSEESANITDQEHLTFTDGSTVNVTRQVNQGMCGPTGVMIGISCNGDKCDNVQLTCAKMLLGHLDMNNCTWTAFQSEEVGARIFPDAFVGNSDFCPGGYCNMVVNGAECQSSWCDNMRFSLCPVVP